MVKPLVRYLSSDDLKKYSGPYKEWRDEFTWNLNGVSEFTGEPEELSLFLLDSILPFVRHQDSVYTSIVLLLKVFSDICERSARYTDEVLYFMGYVFRDYIRDNVGILVEPYDYRYLSPSIKKISSDELSLFESFVSFYESVRDGGVSRNSRIYFDCVLLKSIPENPFLPKELPGDEGNLLTSFLAGLVASHNRWGSAWSIDESRRYFDELTRSSDGLTDLERLPTVITEDDYVPTPWASGRSGAIGSAAHLLLAEGTHQIDVLEKVLPKCLELKAARGGDEVDLAYVDRFILEDVSSILFSKALGATVPFDMARLSREQRFFLDFLSNEYRGHTYTLLYAGILPQGVAPEEVDAIRGVYGLV